MTRTKDNKPLRHIVSSISVFICVRLFVPFLKGRKEEIPLILEINVILDKNSNVILEDLLFVSINRGFQLKKQYKSSSTLVFKEKQIQNNGIALDGGGAYTIPSLLSNICHGSENFTLKMIFKNSTLDC